MWIQDLIVADFYIWLWGWCIYFMQLDDTFRCLKARSSKCMISYRGLCKKYMFDTECS